MSVQEGKSASPVETKAVKEYEETAPPTITQVPGLEPAENHVARQLHRETKDVAYVAAKGDLKALENLLNEHPLFLGNSRDPDLMDSNELVDRQDIINRILEEASASGHIHNLRYLQENIPDIRWDYQFNHRDNNTALHIARINDQASTVEFLIDAGASIDIKNDNGETVLDVAPITLDAMKKRKQQLRSKELEQRAIRAECRRVILAEEALPHDDYSDDTNWPWINERGPVEEIIYSYAFDLIKTRTKEDVERNRIMALVS